jgi:hypothetical protein
MTTKLGDVIATAEAAFGNRPETWWSEPWGPGKWQRRQVLETDIWLAEALSFAGGREP